MSFIKTFDHKLAFVGPTDLLSEKQIPNDSLEVNEKLSLVLAYLYVALREGTENLIMVDDNVIDILKQLLPFHNFGPVTDEYEMDKRNLRVEVLDASGKDLLVFKGILMKPVFVNRDSTVLYSLYEVNDKSQEISKKYCRASLGYFNNVIRNSLSGKGPVIWTDPIANDTKLTDSYDTMFALYIADKFLHVIDTDYPSIDYDENLAKGLALFDIIQNKLGKIKAPVIELVKKEFSPDAVLMKHQTYETITYPEISVPTSEERRHFCDVLHFFARVKVTNTTQAIVVLSGFKSLLFLEFIAQLFPQSKFYVWGYTVPKGKKKIVADNVVLNPKLLKVSDASEYSQEKKDVYYITNLSIYDNIIKAMNPRVALVFHNPQSALKSHFTFASCFTKIQTNNKARSVVNAELKKGKEGGVVKNFFLAVDGDWRNTNAWQYTNVITHRDDDIYDNCFLAYFLERHLVLSNSELDPVKYLQTITNVI